MTSFSLRVRPTFVAATAALIAGCSVTPTSTEPVVIKLIAFNDFHGHINPPASPTLLPNASDSASPLQLSTGGIEYLSTLIAQLKAQNPLHAVVGAGDMIGGSPLISGLFHHESAVELLGQAGMEFSSVGNHEFDAGRAELLRIQNGGCHAEGGANTCVNGRFAGAQFKYLAANVIDEQTGTTLFPGHAVKEFTSPGGRRLPVAFIGLVLKETPQLVVASGVAGLSFGDEAAAANALVPQLRRQGIETIVVLIHQGGYTQQASFDDASCPEFVGAIKDIAARLDPAIDVIVSGHTHRPYICHQDGRLITSTGAEGRQVTDIDLTIDPTTRDVIRSTARQLAAVNERLPNPLPDKYPTLTKDPRLAPLVSFYNTRAAPLAQREVGKLAGAMTRQAAASGESPLGNLVADAQLAATRSAGAQVAFMNRDGIRSDLRGDGGVVSYSDLFSVHPFGNGLITLSLTGEQIDTLLEQQWQRTDSMLQVSANFSYEWNAAAAAGSRVDIGHIRLDGAPIQPAMIYRVTVNEFMAQGGNGFAVLKNAQGAVRGVLDIEALETYIKQYSPVVAPSGGRILRVN